MKPTVKTLQPNEFLEAFMRFGSKRKEIFKQGYELFFIARMQDLTELTRLPVPPVKTENHNLFFLTSGSLTMKVGTYSIEIIYQKQN